MRTMSRSQMSVFGEINPLKCDHVFSLLKTSEQLNRTTAKQLTLGGWRGLRTPRIVSYSVGKSESSLSRRRTRLTEII